MNGTRLVPSLRVVNCEPRWHCLSSRRGLIKIENGRNMTLASVILLANALGNQGGDFFPTLGALGLMLASDGQPLANVRVALHAG